MVREFFGCYLLKSVHPDRPGRTYIGFTVNPKRRIRQHNGEVKGGAARTKMGRPWEMTLVLYGFPTMVQALRFEWAWQHPEKSKSVRQTATRMKPKDKQGVKGKMGLMLEMLHLSPWCYFPLTLQFLSSTYGHMSSRLKQPPPHVKASVAPMADLPQCVDDDEDPAAAAEELGGEVEGSDTEGSCSDAEGSEASAGGLVKRAGVEEAASQRAALGAGVPCQALHGGAASGSEHGESGDENCWHTLGGSAPVWTEATLGAEDLVSGNIRCTLCEKRVTTDLVQCAACSCPFDLECIARHWILLGPQQQPLLAADAGGVAGRDEHGRGGAGAVPAEGPCPACQKTLLWTSLLRGMRSVGWLSRGKGRGRRRGNGRGKGKGGTSKAAGRAAASTKCVASGVVAKKPTAEGLPKPWSGFSPVLALLMKHAGQQPGRAGKAYRGQSSNLDSVDDARRLEKHTIKEKAARQGHAVPVIQSPRIVKKTASRMKQPAATTAAAAAVSNSTPEKTKKQGCKKTRAKGMGKAAADDQAHEPAASGRVPSCDLTTTRVMDTQELAGGGWLQHGRAGFNGPEAIELLDDDDVSEAALLDGSDEGDAWERWVGETVGGGGPAAAGPGLRARIQAGGGVDSPQLSAGSPLREDCSCQGMPGASQRGDDDVDRRHPSESPPPLQLAMRLRSRAAATRHPDAGRPASTHSLDPAGAADAPVDLTQDEPSDVVCCAVTQPPACTTSSEAALLMSCLKMDSPATSSSVAGSLGSPMTARGEDGMHHAAAGFHPRDSACQGSALSLTLTSSVSKHAGFSASTTLAPCCPSLVPSAECGPEAARKRTHATKGSTVLSHAAAAAHMPRSQRVDVCPKPLSSPADMVESHASPCNPRPPLECVIDLADSVTPLPLRRRLLQRHPDRAFLAAQVPCPRYEALVPQPPASSLQHDVIEISNDDDSN